jgi:membrane protein YdbS with pleckstrin-like domain
MITPRKMFRYSAAATAGYVLTEPVVAWMISVAKTLVIVACLSVLGAIASIVAWFNSIRPIDSHWALIYLGICILVLALSVVPLVLGCRFFCRYFHDKEEGKT